MSGKIIKAGDLDMKKVKFADNIKTNKYSGKSVYVNYDNGPFRIQMPKMSLPFGVSIYEDPKTSEKKYTLELSWAGVKDEVFDFFKEIENKIIDYAEANSKELFKKQKQRVVLEESYNSFLKINRDEDGNVVEKYAPRLKVKMYVDGNNFSVDAYDAEKVDGKYPRIHLTKDNIEDYLSKGSKIETILQCSGFWVVDNKFGISWVVAQVKIYKNENKLVGYAFEDDEEQEDGEVDVEQEEVPEVPEEPEESEEPEDEPEIVEAPQKEKKQRRKREYL